MAREQQPRPADPKNEHRNGCVEPSMALREGNGWLHSNRWRFLRPHGIVDASSLSHVSDCLATMWWRPWSLPPLRRFAACPNPRNAERACVRQHTGCRLQPETPSGGFLPSRVNHGHSAGGAGRNVSVMDGPSDRAMVTCKGGFPSGNRVKKKSLAETGATTPSIFTFVTSFARKPTKND
jgi:hypothetical protein